MTPRPQAAGGQSTRWGCCAVRECVASPRSPGRGHTRWGHSDGGTGFGYTTPANPLRASASSIAIRLAQSAIWSSPMRLHVPDRLSERDAMIAATAMVHRMTVVTRNVADFEASGVALLNPWIR